MLTHRTVVSSTTMGQEVSGHSMVWGGEGHSLTLYTGLVPRLHTDLPPSLTHNHHVEVAVPALPAEEVPTLQTCHLLQGTHTSQTRARS